MMYKYCQVCGNPIFSAESHGTEASGQYNRDFCSSCYRGGSFTSDLSADGSAMYHTSPYYSGEYGYMGNGMQ